MNENIDLTKILDGCPVGTEFYHAGFGRVWLAKIYPDAESHVYPIALSLNENNPLCHSLYVTAKGTLDYECEGERLLFPSKIQRDWSKFVRFWDKPEKFNVNTLQPFDKILARNGNIYPWTCLLFSHIDNPKSEYPIVAGGTEYKTCIPYNDETAHLRGTFEDCPKYYKWWEE